MGASRDVASGFGVVGCSILLFIIVLFGGGALYVVYINTIGKATVDAQREVTQHSQQYVETKTGLLLSLIEDAEDPNITPGQRIATIDRFCFEYEQVDFDVPSSVHAYAAKNCDQ